jgi:hypothetical protein
MTLDEPNGFLGRLERRLAERTDPVGSLRESAAGRALTSRGVNHEHHWISFR